MSAARKAPFMAPTPSPASSSFSLIAAPRAPPLSASSAKAAAFSSGRGGGQISGLLGTFDYSGAASYFRPMARVPTMFHEPHALRQFRLHLQRHQPSSPLASQQHSDAGIPGQTLFAPPSLHQRYDQQLSAPTHAGIFPPASTGTTRSAGAESYTRQHSFNPRTELLHLPIPIPFVLKPIPLPSRHHAILRLHLRLRFHYNRANFRRKPPTSSANSSAPRATNIEVENASIYYLHQPARPPQQSGGFLDFRYSPSRVSLDFGGRVEDNEHFGTRVVPRAGGTYALRYGKGFCGDTRLPRLLRPGHQGTSFRPDLRHRSSAIPAILAQTRIQ